MASSNPWSGFTTATCLHQAREQLRDEVATNRRTIADDQHFLSVAEEDSRANLVVLDPAGHSQQKLHFGWRWDAPQNSAWMTARETGALALMPYQEVQALSSAYEQQALLEAEATSHIHNYTQSLAPLLRHGDLKGADVNSLSPQVREQLADSYAKNLTEIAVLRDLISGLDVNYQKLQGSQTVAQHP